MLRRYELCVYNLSYAYGIILEVQDYCMVEGATFASKELLYRFSKCLDCQQGQEQPDHIVADMLYSRQWMKKQRCRGEDSQREKQRGYKSPLRLCNVGLAITHDANNIMDHARSWINRSTTTLNDRNGAEPMDLSP